MLRTAFWRRPQKGRTDSLWKLGTQKSGSDDFSVGRVQVQNLPRRQGGRGEIWQDPFILRPVDVPP